VDYFDSFETKTPLNYNIRFPLKITHSLNKNIQSPYSDSCGKYCVYFLYMRSTKFSYKWIMKNFGNDLNANEAYVKYSYDQIRFNHTSVLLTEPHSHRQHCCARKIRQEVHS